MKLLSAPVAGLIAVLCLTNAPPAALAVQEDYGQITFENHTSASLECYVDDNYVGTALKGLFITVEATAGEHSVRVATVEDQPRETGRDLTVEAGGTITYTITED